MNKTCFLQLRILPSKEDTDEKTENYDSIRIGIRVSTRGTRPKKRGISPKWESPDLSPHRTEHTAHKNPVQLGTWAGSKGITTSSCLISSLSLFSLAPTLVLSSTIHIPFQLSYALKLLAELFLLLPKHNLHFPTFPSHPFILILPLMASSHSQHSIAASLLNKNHYGCLGGLEG